MNALPHNRLNEYYYWDETLHILYLMRLFRTSNTFENIVCRIEVIFLSSICGMTSPIDWYKAIYNPTQDDAGIVTICVCPNVFEMSLIWENIYIFCFDDVSVTNISEA